MMNSIIRFLQVVFISLALVCTSQVYAQDYSRVQIGQPYYNKIYFPRQVRCQPCAFLTYLYNDTREDMLDSGDEIDDLDEELYDLENQLDRSEEDVARLKRAFIKHPTSAVRQELESAEARQQSLSRQYTRELRYLDWEERYYDAARYKLDQIEKKLNDCEARFCNLAVMTSPLIASLYYYQYLAALDLSMVFSNTTSSQRAYLDTPLELLRGSHSQNNLGFGPQIRFLLGTSDTVRLFILLNALSIFDNNNTLLKIKTDILSNYLSKVLVSTDWVGHALLGVESRPFYSRFTASAGAGVAIITQKITTSIGETGITESSSRKTSVQPSVLASLNYAVCPSCVSGRPLTLSAQVWADRYPSLKTTVITPLGNSYFSKTNSTWQFSEALVLSVKF